MIVQNSKLLAEKVSLLTVAHIHPRVGYIPLGRYEFSVRQISSGEGEKIKSSQTPK